jgi:hypothetical protein
MKASMSKRKDVKEEGNIQAFNDAKCTRSEFVPENREKPVEECHWPTTLWHEKDDDLSDDEQAVQDSPEDASGLIGNCASSVQGIQSASEWGHTEEKIDAHAM